MNFSVFYFSTRNELFLQMRIQFVWVNSYTDYGYSLNCVCGCTIHRSNVCAAMRFEIKLLLLNSYFDLFKVISFKLIDTEEINCS